VQDRPDDLEQHDDLEQDDVDPDRLPEDEDPLAGGVTVDDDAGHRGEDVEDGASPAARTDGEPTTTQPEEPGTAPSGGPAGGATPEEEGDAAAPRKGRTSVPSWDDIMFGSGNRRR
jgi:hypothetical protein